MFQRVFRKGDASGVPFLRPRLNQLGRSLLITALVFLTLGAASLWLGDLHRPGFSGDGFGYYAPLASIVFDQDLDFHNELAHLNRRYLRAAFMTPEGLLGNPFPIGPAILWAPFVWGVQELPPSEFMDAPLQVGVRTRHRGYSPRFARALFFGQLAWVFLAAAVVTAVVAVWSGAWPAVIAMLASFLGTPLFYYALAEPSYGHAASFVAVAVFLSAILLDRKKSLPLALLSGLFGLVVLVRTQDAALGLLLIPRILDEWNAHHGARRTLVRRAAQLLLPFAGIAGLQWLYWLRIYGELVWVPPGPDFLPWWKPHVLQLLFSTWNGAFIWSPILLLALWGLTRIENRALRLSMFFALAVEVYLGAGLADWWGGRSFGARRMVSLVPFAVLGIALLLHHAQRYYRVALLIGIALAVMWSVQLGRLEVHGFMPGNPGSAADYLRHYAPGSPESRPYGHWDYLRLGRDVAQARRAFFKRKGAEPRSR